MNVFCVNDRGQCHRKAIVNQINPILELHRDVPVCLISSMADDRRLTRL